MIHHSRYCASYTNFMGDAFVVYGALWDWPSRSVRIFYSEPEA
jgi:hypothetical protein